VAYLLPKFHENRPLTFEVILLSNRQTNSGQTDPLQPKAVEVIIYQSEVSKAISKSFPHVYNKC